MGPRRSAPARPLALLRCFCPTSTPTAFPGAGGPRVAPASPAGPSPRPARRRNSPRGSPPRRGGRPAPLVPGAASTQRTRGRAGGRPRPHWGRLASGGEGGLKPAASGRGPIGSGCRGEGWASLRSWGFLPKQSVGDGEDVPTLGSSPRSTIDSGPREAAGPTRPLNTPRPKTRPRPPWGTAGPSVLTCLPQDPTTPRTSSLLGTGGERREVCVEQVYPVGYPHLQPPG